MKSGVSTVEDVLKQYNVELDQSKYEIIIGKSVLGNIGSLLAKKTNDPRVMIVADHFFEGPLIENIQADLTQHNFQPFTHYFNGGKTNKNINEAIRIYEILEQNCFARDSTLIALGGGVIGDLAGFVASTHCRGMNLIHIPTTLTAMIDSSIGGKVGINHGKTINAIGNYYHPILNIVDLNFLNTLPYIDFKSGMAEIIKCSIIHDKEFYDFLDQESEGIKSSNLDQLLHAICRTIEIKLFHVKDDVKENYKRLKLNYGHTIGHAIESATGLYDEIYRHGEGVALGMVGAAHIAKDYFGHGPDLLRKHEDILKKYDLPIKVYAKEIGHDYDTLMKDCLEIIQKDKKRKNNKLRFILPNAIGQSDVYADITEPMVVDAFEYLIKK